MMRNLCKSREHITLQKIPLDQENLMNLRRYLKHDFSYITGPLYFMFSRALKKGEFHGLYLKDAEKEIGYAIVKDISNLGLTLIKFLAILPPYRSGGYGSVFMDQLKLQFGNLILEVEDPDKVQDNNQEEKVTRSRRITFYERNGLQLDPDIKFIHAGYPLRVMSNIMLPKADWLHIFRNSHNQLYGLPISRFILKLAD